MDLTSHFPQRQQTYAHAHIVGRNKYSAEFGLGPLINGLTYPVLYSSIFHFASHGAYGDSGDAGGGGGDGGGRRKTCLVLVSSHDTATWIQYYCGSTSPREHCLLQLSCTAKTRRRPESSWHQINTFARVGGGEGRLVGLTNTDEHSGPLFLKVKVRARAFLCHFASFGCVSDGAEDEPTI